MVSTSKKILFPTQSPIYSHQVSCKNFKVWFLTFKSRVWATSRTSSSFLWPWLRELQEEDKEKEDEEGKEKGA